MPDFTFFDDAALLHRLSKGLQKREQEVVFLVGSPLCYPITEGGPGVPSVDGVIELIRREFEDDPEQCTALDNHLDSAGQNRYQQAFLFLQGRRGPQTANDIIRQAVCSARTTPTKSLDAKGITQASVDDECRRLEFDITNWALTTGMGSLGHLLVQYPDRFGRSILTTNFDPLIEVSIRRAGGNYFRTTLHSDGNFSHTEGNGCHVVHLHGYWYGSDTLHTARQLGQSRPHLRDSLNSLLRNKLAVVCAYGAWDDAFTEAMMGVVRDDTAFPEIIWTFHSKTPDHGSPLFQQLAPGIDRGRVNLYAGVDCHALFSRLHDIWRSIETPTSVQAKFASNPVQVDQETIKRIETLRSEERTSKAVVLEGDDEDRPPVVDICVGRERELHALAESKASVIFLTGLGGQGKSTLAARYFADCQVQKAGFSLYVWRDCKEESERFENQLASVVEKLSAGTISGKDLAKQDAQDIVQSFMTFATEKPTLFVFDNVDHYVDLENGRMNGAPDIFVRAFQTAGLQSQVVFTCRPSISYDGPLLSLRLEGLNIEASRRLFAERGAHSEPREIEDAHSMTKGHAFWLDLLAIQVAKPGSTATLTHLLSEIRKGGETLLPAATLNSVWKTLRERQQIVLRSMAETVKPETEAKIGSYVSHVLNYNQFMKAMNALRALNLVVIKRPSDGPELLELHPLVRQFIRKSFAAQERKSFIDAIITVYQRFIADNRPSLSQRPTLSLLENWTQTTELDISAGRIKDAVQTLSEASHAFAASAYPREFCRTARLLLSSFDWVRDHSHFARFDEVFTTHAETLSYLGEYAEVDHLVAEYEKTVPVKDARYIRFCGLRSLLNWLRGDFTAAVHWGTVGSTLKQSSDVDITYDISHQLALAQRDAGQPDSALLVFLKGRNLAEVVDPDELDESRGGQYYGNVGRCLQFMGQIDGALVCYQKSALLLEKDPATEQVRNQGYARHWIGQLLAARGQLTLALAFFRSAYIAWSRVSPPQAAVVTKLYNDLADQIKNPPKISDGEAERAVVDWILGRVVDAKFR
jgi:hypothetical protein